MNVYVLECEGFPHHLWVIKCMTLYNNKVVLVGEGTCHSVNFNFVLGTSGPLGDMHIGRHIPRRTSPISRCIRS